jgi:hypothetical protein
MQDDAYISAGSPLDLRSDPLDRKRSFGLDAQIKAILPKADTFRISKYRFLSTIIQ